mmetsp:Transcript_46961/g.130839  ORF Transcript_46961/g.130839 Transcript_46961/m.130839 type:complete len:97 (+) Transcript_46961:618-908(+)
MSCCGRVQRRERDDRAKRLVAVKPFLDVNRGVCGGEAAASPLRAPRNPSPRASDVRTDRAESLMGQGVRLLFSINAHLVDGVPMILSSCPAGLRVQ